MRSPLRPPAAVAALLVLAACSEAGEVSAPPEFPVALDLVPAPTSFCGVATEVALYADETIQAGTVRVVNDEDHLYVTYRTDATWPVSKTALFVGPSVDAIPTNGPGNPRVGAFPYKATHRPSRTEVTWEVPLGATPGETVVIAAFAEVGDDGEGAWGDGAMIRPGGSWATYFTHVIQACGTQIEPAVGGTATFGDLVELFVPQFSIEQPAFITIEPSARTHPQAVEGTVFDFGPEGLTFDPPAELTIVYDPAVLPAGVPENALRGFAVNGIFEFLPFKAIDEDANTVSFDVEHFSTYGVGVLSADLSVDAAATPSPARISDDIVIDVRVSNALSPVATVEDANVLITLSGIFFFRTFVSDACAADPVLGPNNEVYIHCTTGPLGPGDIVPFEIMGSPLAGSEFGTLAVTAQVMPHAQTGYVDVNTTNNLAISETQILPDVTADVRMAAFGPGAPRQAGLERTLTATAENLATSVDAVATTIQFHFTDAGAPLLEVPTDQLPAGCSVTQVSAQTTIACAVGILAPGESAARAVVVRPLAARFYPVNAVAQPTAGDPVPANNTIIGGLDATETVTDMAARIVASQTAIDAGSDVTFSARAENLGGDLLPRGTLRIEIDGDFTLLDAPTGCDAVAVAPFEAAFNCPLVEIPATQSSATSLIVIQSTTPGTTITAHARLLMPDYVQDGNPSNDMEQVDVEVNPEPAVDLRMKGFGPGAPRQAGTLRTLTAIAENVAASPDAVDASIQFYFKDAGAVGLEIITDQLPAGCTYQQVSSETRITCAVGSLAPGAEATRQVVVRPLQARTYFVDAIALPLAGDAAPANNTMIGSFEATETLADLAADITSDQTEIGGGDNVAISARAANLSGQTLPMGTLRIEIDGDITLIDSPAGCDAVDVFPYEAAFNCAVEDLAAGGFSATYGTIVQANTPGTAITGQARLLLPDYVQDSDGSNDSEQITITVRPDVSVDLRMAAFGPGAPRQAGIERTLTAQAENLATSTDAVDASIQFYFKDAGAVGLEVITDQLPAGCTHQQVSSETRITCDVGSLAPGATSTRQVVVRPLQVKTYFVDAIALPTAGDAAPGNNTIIGSLEATATSLDLAASIDATSTDIDVGANVGFSASVAHLSGDMLPNGTLRIEIEGDATLVDADARCDQVNVFPFIVALNCALPQLQAGESSNDFLVVVQGTANGSITGHARLLLPDYVQDTNGANDTEEVTVTVGGAVPAGTLLFSSNRITGSLAQLFTKNLATGTTTRITDLQNFTDAQWSPDGTRIVAIRGAGMWLMDADGGNAVEYNLGSRDDVVAIGSPSWSPDGSKVVLHGVSDSDPGQDMELWVFDVATTGLTRLTDNSGNDEFPTWSPQGTAIAYTVDRTALYTINPNGTDPLPMLTGASVLHPDWSPDGSRLAFTQLEATGSSIAVMDAGDPSSLVTLESDGRGNVNPAWSPDGLFIGFSKAQIDDDALFDLYYILADGTGSAQVLEAIVNFSTFDVDWK